MAIDHLGFNVADFPRSRAYYPAALAPLGLVVVGEGDRWADIGRDGRPVFWFGSYSEPARPLHLAFAAADRAAVRAFYEAALAAGAKDNGAPGLRPQYHADYYGAFVIDPDGHNLEAVCHRPGA